MTKLPEALLSSLSACGPAEAGNRSAVREPDLENRAKLRVTVAADDASFTAGNRPDRGHQKVGRRRDRPPCGDGRRHAPGQTAVDFHQHSKSSMLAPSALIQVIPALRPAAYFRRAPNRTKERNLALALHKDCNSVRKSIWKHLE